MIRGRRDSAFTVAGRTDSGLRTPSSVRQAAAGVAQVAALRRHQRSKITKRVRASNVAARMRAK